MLSNMKLLLRTILFSSALCVFGLENLNFFGEYVVFTPQTKAIKFDLQNEMDVLMLDREVNATMAIDYLYRVQILMNDTDHMHENPNGTKFRGQNIYITLFKENHTMLTGSYHLWNLTEAKDVSIDWGSEQNVIEVLTTVNGNQYSIFSWKDRSKRETRVRNLGVRVSKENSTENQHTKWKLREADSKDFDIRKAYRMCDIRLLAEHPNSFNSNNNINSTNSTNSSNSTNSTNSTNSSNSTNSINSTNTTNSNKPIYEIFISREQDEKFTVSLYKNSTEKAYVKTDRMDSHNIYVTWDNDTGLIMLGMKNELTPLLMWQDTTSKINNDLGSVKFVTIVQYTSGRQHPTTTEVKKDTFKTIPDFYPKYFTNSSTLIAKNPQSTTESARKSKTRSFDVTDEDLRELVLSDEEDLVE